MSGIYRIMFLSLLIIVGTSYAQRGGRTPSGKITGIVIDAVDKQPLEYANIILFDAMNDVMLTGTTTNVDGVFILNQLRPGRYYLQIDYIGFEKEKIDSVNIRSANVSRDIGTVTLNRASYELDGIQVLGDQVSMEYKIDKKIINVARQSTSLSGTAVDVLENSPSVTVDIEGNVSLRGSTDFLVLIDNKPTVFDPSDALEQIPASAINKIEIITNPSAKYDPEGTSGIINIITKNSMNGFNGLVNLNGGLDNKYGGDILVNYKKGDFNIFIGGDYNNRTFPGTRSSLTETTIGDTTNLIESSGAHDREMNSYSIRGGISFNLTDNDIITLDGRYGNRDFGRVSTMEYKEWTQPASTEYNYTNTSDHNRAGDFFSTNFDYTHKFSSDGHELVMQAFYSKRDQDENVLNELLDENNLITDSQKYIEGGPESRIRLKANYKLPFNSKNYFEAGYQADVRKEEGFSDAYEYDVPTGDYIFVPGFSNETKYTRDIQSLYSTYTGEQGDFGYQLGLRGEYTYRTMELLQADDIFKIDRIDFFPTLHFSYAVEENSQVMASYSRRIVRPRDHALEPFLTWIDSYNVRQGNPDIEPQYINSFEAGYLKHFEWGSVSLEGYYRVTNNKFERVRSVYDVNVMLHTYENVGKSYAMGTEFMFSSKPFEWWTFNLMGNLYDYRQDGRLYGVDYENSSFNWSARVNSTINILPSTRLQLTMMFDSPSVTSQGRREGMYMVNAAVRHEIIPKSLTATLQVRDIFGTGKREFTADGPSFYSTMEMTRKAPMVMLTVSYNINNYKKKIERDRENGEEMQMNDDF